MKRRFKLILKQSLFAAGNSYPCQDIPHASAKIKKEQRLPEAEATERERIDT